MSRTLRQLSLLFLALFTYALGACKQLDLPQMRPTVRALWVTRFDYKTKEDCARIAEACKIAGFNTILFQVRGNATAFYRSSLEPWAEQFNYADPGFDPLAVMLDEAHARGLRVHAWMNVLPAWWGTQPPKDPKQVVNAHPEWLWYDAKGQRQPYEDKFYVSLNPCLPEVREYIVKVFEDVVGRYPIDGVHMDYIRFPNEKANGVDYPRDAKTVALFKAATGATPDSDPAAWARWRTEQVTALVSEIRYMMKHTKDYIDLSAAVGAEPEQALKAHFQDSVKWLNDELVDVVYPMNYAADDATFTARAQAWKKIGGDRVVMGLRVFDEMPGGAAEPVPASYREKLYTSLEYNNGFSVFAYASIFDSPNDTINPQTEAARQRRVERRRVLMPILQEASKSGALSDR